MEPNKIVNYGRVIFIIELLMMGIWFYYAKPHLSTALSVFQIVFLLFGINLILALILYFFKKAFTKLFLANAIICPFIFYALWIMWFSYWAK